jgi:hypothetical protein
VIKRSKIAKPIPVFALSSCLSSSYDFFLARIELVVVDVHRNDGIAMYDTSHQRQKSEKLDQVEIQFSASLLIS